MVTEKKVVKQDTIASMIAFSAFIEAMIDLIDEIEAGFIDTGDGAEE